MMFGKLRTLSRATSNVSRYSMSATELSHRSILNYKPNVIQISSFHHVATNKSTSKSLSNTSLLKDQHLLESNNIFNIRTCVKRFSSGNPTSSVPPQLWKLGRLNHVAIAVPDLEASTAFYRDVLGATVSAPDDLTSHGVRVVFVELENTKLELLYPLGEKSPIAKFLAKNKSGGLHHVCLEVDDISQAMAAVTKAGIRCLAKKPTIGAHGKPVVFLHPADCNGVLLELEEA